MLRAHVRSLGLGAAVFAACSALPGCGDFSAPRSGDVVPVVQALLILGDSTQHLTVFWSIPPDSPAVVPPRPVDSSAVRLFLVRPAGDSVRFSPVAGKAGTYEALTSITAGLEYRLAGTLATHAVNGRTVVPDTLVMGEPAGDTIHLASGPFGYVTVSYRWHAAGAALYRYTAGPASGFVNDTIGDLRLVRPPNPATVPLSVLSLEPRAAAFLRGSVPVSTLDGVLGFLGAASLARRTIVWQ